jgi:hypothetical protein
LATAILRVVLGRVALIALTALAVRLVAFPAVCSTSSHFSGGLDGLRQAADAITRSLDGAGRL